MQEWVYNAHKLYGEIQQRGYSGGERRVRDYARERRRPQAPVATVCFELWPGSTK